jgi:hypothetical protein
MKNLAGVLLVLLTAAVTAACVTTRAATPATRPALEVPPVPPRVIEPAPAPPAPTPELVADLPPAPAPPPRPKPAGRETGPRETAKPEPKPPENPTAETIPATQPTPPAAVPPLRTARTADGAQVERQIRDILGRASSLLGRVNYQKLTPERRKAYDQAKQFGEGAELAIKDGKFEYALELAEKAETLAKELQG